MIDKINQEIEDLETKWEKLRKSSEGNLFNTTIYVQFRATEEKLEQAKKDKKIIEEGLEELEKAKNNVPKGSQAEAVLDVLNQKLKNEKENN